MCGTIITLIRSIAIILPWLKVEASPSFTPIDLKALVLTRKHTITQLEAYVTRERARIDTLKKSLIPFKMETLQPRYLENPFNCFKVVKRLTIDFNIMNTIMFKKTEYKRKMHATFPGTQDLDEAASDLLRLQTANRLNVSQLANDPSSVTTASDCYELAKYFIYKSKVFNEALPWLFESLRKCLEQCDGTSQIQIFKHISNAYFYLEDVPAAFKWRERYLNKTPLDPRIIQKTIERHQHRQRKMMELHSQRTEPYKDFVEVTNALCRGEIEVPKVIQKNLFCRFLSGPHPFLRLARVKLEQLYIEPSVILLHDVISDHEIQHLQNITENKMQWSFVKLENVRSERRKSKSAWIYAEDSPIAAKIQRRVTMVTGLSEGTEGLQVAKYEVGGQYVPHHDFFGISHNDTSVYPTGGDRIATIVFYMSEVAQGGATVFLHPGLTVYPEKGAALFFMNMLPSGEFDLTTEHASCAVIQGNKWVTVVWKQQIGQELAKPCNLNHQKMSVVQHLHPLIPKLNPNRYPYTVG